MHVTWMEYRFATMYQGIINVICVLIVTTYFPPFTYEHDKIENGLYYNYNSLLKLTNIDNIKSSVCSQQECSEFNSYTVLTFPSITSDMYYFYITTIYR